MAFEDWKDAAPSAIYSELKGEIAEYEPGAFYKRELPCILSILDEIPKEELQYLVVDGYVTLDNEGHWGLGAYLFDALGGKYPVIGVAKTRYARNTDKVVEVLRGESKNPLFVSVMGVELETAASYIQTMHREFRIPTLLKQLDNLTKERD